MKPLAPGDQAPMISNMELVYPEKEGSQFNLEQALTNDQSILLSFHRYASCPICNFSLRQFQNDYYSLLDKGIRYVPVFHSSIENMQEAYPEKPPFSIIADPEMTLYKLYRLTPSISAFLHPKALKDGFKAINSIIQPGYKFKLAPEKTLLTKPADFLISPDGKIKFAHYGKSLGDSITVEEAKSLTTLI